jgi:hypothetical protein
MTAKTLSATNSSEDELFLLFPEHGIDKEFAELRFPGALF